jgi:serine phosphatase RsbU (regulator of sigma subunit)
MRITITCLFILWPVMLRGMETINEFEELANGYANQGKLAQAAEFYSKAGYAYWNKGNNTRAALSFQKSYDLFSKQGNILASITVGNNLGLIYLDDEKYSNAYTAFANVLMYTRKTKNTDGIFNAIINLGTVAFELASFNDAISKATEALGLAREMNNLRSIAKCYSLLAESYEKMGDASNAYKYFELYSSVDQKIKMQEMDNVKQMSAEEVNKAQEKKRVTEIELKIKKGELKLTQDSLTVTARLAYERQMQVELRNEQLKKKEIQLRYELHIRRSLILVITLTVFFLLILGFLLRQKLNDNKTLRRQKEEITQQRNKLDVQNKKITDSIHYGLRIQQAMLPDMNELYKRFETFVLYRPKDIVSGDFYWFYEIETENIVYRFIALADCTGHGVPGAFMSMIGHRLLSEVVVARKIYQTSLVLEEINKHLRKELDQDNKKSMDGMDVALCRLMLRNGVYEELVFAGAKRPILVYNRDANKLHSMDGDRKGIGGFLSGDAKSFTDQTVRMQTGDMLFLYSDGIIDQQNSGRNRFGTQRFTSAIQEHIQKPMVDMKTAIEKAFDFYIDTEEQRDDITVIGLRLN